MPLDSFFENLFCKLPIAIVLTLYALFPKRASEHSPQHLFALNRYNQSPLTGLSSAAEE